MRYRIIKTPSNNFQVEKRYFFWPFWLMADWTSKLVSPVNAVILVENTPKFYNNLREAEKVVAKLSLQETSSLIVKEIVKEYVV